MPKPDIVQVVRRFMGNGLKALLENPQNVRELLVLEGTDLLDLIDFARMTVTKTTFVQRDFRHIESDVVLVAPYRSDRSHRFRKALTLYLLIEHQSEPDRLMPLRVLEYVVQIFKHQTREWARHHASLENIQLRPVLPVVFYTGTRRWDALGRLVDLIEGGELFEEVTPILKPLFLNLGAIPLDRLRTAGYFGRVLELVQHRGAQPADFRQRLAGVIGDLETMPPGERLRWLELLSYIHALVYHERESSEHRNLGQTIKASVQTDEHKQEVDVMGRTIADAFREEGKLEGKLEALRNTLLDQLRGRFQKVPREIATAIQATENLAQLNAWLKRVITVKTLGEMDIKPEA